MRDLTERALVRAELWSWFARGGEPPSSCVSCQERHLACLASSQEALVEGPQHRVACDGGYGSHIEGVPRGGTSAADVPPQASLPAVAVVGG